MLCGKDADKSFSQPLRTATAAQQDTMQYAPPAITLVTSSYHPGYRPLIILGHVLLSLQVTTSYHPRSRPLITLVTSSLSLWFTTS